MAHLLWIRLRIILRSIDRIKIIDLGLGLELDLILQDWIPCIRVICPVSGMLQTFAYIAEDKLQ